MARQLEVNGLIIGICSEPAQSVDHATFGQTDRSLLRGLRDRCGAARARRVPGRAPVLPHVRCRLHGRPGDGHRGGYIDNLKFGAVVGKHGITAGAEDRPGIRTLPALRRDPRAVDEDTRERLFPLLTEGELEACQAAVQEQREQNRERVRNNRVTGADRLPSACCGSRDFDPGISPAATSGRTVSGSAQEIFVFMGIILKIVKFFLAVETQQLVALVAHRIVRRLNSGETTKELVDK